MQHSGVAKRLANAPPTHPSTRGTWERILLAIWSRCCDEPRAMSRSSSGTLMRPVAATTTRIMQTTHQWRRPISAPAAASADKHREHTSREQVRCVDVSLVSLPNVQSTPNEISVQIHIMLPSCHFTILNYVHVGIAISDIFWHLRGMRPTITIIAFPTFSRSCLISPCTAASTSEHSQHY